MRLSVATWNINSVRLRLPQVLKLLEDDQPDILCLQETKCPDDQFPFAELRKLGYPHIAISGQKGYNGVAVISKFPFSEIDRRPFCGKTDCRHIAVRLGAEAGAGEGLVVHNFYVPAGGDIPDPDQNVKFAHKLAFLEELTGWSESLLGHSDRSILVGDLNIAPLEHDVWSHKQLLSIVSHTPVETTGLLRAQTAGGWIDAVRSRTPEPEKIYTWWSYRSPDWQTADKGRRLDHIWMSPNLDRHLIGSKIQRQTRGWERPSDHVPIISALEL